MTSALRLPPSGLPFIGVNQDDTLLWDATAKAWYVGPGGGGGAVDSVFGRTGIVTAQSGDYDSDLITNNSLVAGISVSDALDTLLAAIVGIAINVSSPLIGDGTIGNPLAVSNFDLTASYVSNGPSNTFLKGTGSGNQWAALFTTPANPADNGRVTIASNGDFSYLAGTIAGNALIWSGSAWAASNDFFARDLITTGGYISNIGTGFIRLGLAAGSGAGVASAASTGNIRVARGAPGFTMVLRNDSDTADFTFLATDTTSNSATLGSLVASGPNGIVAAPAAGTVALRIGSSTNQVLLSISTMAVTVPSITLSGDAAKAIVRSLTANATGFTTTITGQTTNANGGTGGQLILEGGGVTGVSGTLTGGKVTVRGNQGGTVGGVAELLGGGSTTTGGDVLIAAGFGPAGGTVRGQTGGATLGTGTTRISWNDTGLGLYNVAPIARQTVTGSRGGATVAVLTDLLSKLNLLGAIIDGTTA